MWYELKTDEDQKKVINELKTYGVLTDKMLAQGIASVENVTDKWETYVKASVNSHNVANIIPVSRAYSTVEEYSTNEEEPAETEDTKVERKTSIVKGLVFGNDQTYTRSLSSSDKDKDTSMEQYLLNAMFERLTATFETLFFLGDKDKNPKEWDGIVKQISPENRISCEGNTLSFSAIFEAPKIISNNWGLPNTIIMPRKTYVGLHFMGKDLMQIFNPIKEMVWDEENIKVYSTRLFENEKMVLVGQVNPSVLTFRLITPVVKINLMPQGTTHKFLLAFAGAPILFAPKKWSKIENYAEFTR